MDCRQRGSGVTRSIAIGLLLGLVPATTVAAQHMVPVGVRVRVVLDEERRQAENRVFRTTTIRGEVTAESAESLWVRPTRVTGSVGISKAGIRTLGRSTGAPNRVRSLFRDGIGGAIVGAIDGALFYSSFGTKNALFGANSRGEAAGSGAAYGAAIFGIIGFILPVEYWRRVPLD